MQKRAVILTISLLAGIWSGAFGWPQDAKPTQAKESGRTSAIDERTQRLLQKNQPHIDRGLAWLAQQQKRDGHWEANEGHYPIAMTALAGLAFLAEGSTIRQGRYAENIDKAVDFLLTRVQKKTGMIGNPNYQREQYRYMYGHGFATLFLSQVYGEESDEFRRRELEKVLTGAVDFIGKAQTKLGGWGYLTAQEGQDFDEGSVTITQLQALRAAKNAGIPVAHEIIEKAKEYLRKSTVIVRRETDPRKEEAAVVYSLQQRQEMQRPPLTAAGIACMFSAGEYESDLAVKWLNYCQRMIPISSSDNNDVFRQWEYTHFYYAQVLYTLGDDRHAKMRPDLPDDKLLKWSRYRESIFDILIRKQNADGSWSHNQVGPVYTTALYLIMMQLDKGNVPIYQR